MNQTSIIDKIVMFGITRQEASIYLCLLQNMELTGYEAAKLTGISRSNVYNALAGLVEKGAAYVMEGTTSKYVAVPVREFCDDKIRKMRETADYLGEHIPNTLDTTVGYITILGDKHILDRIHHMILETEQRLYLSASREFLAQIREDLAEVSQRGIKVVILTDKEFALDGAILYQTVNKEKQIRMIVDSKYVLTGEVTGSHTDTCLYSGQKNFVNVFKEAMHNEIRLIELTGGENRNE